MNFPKEFEDKLKSMLADEFSDFKNAMEQNHEVKGIRVNTQKITVEAFKALCPFALKPIPWCPEGFYVEDDDFRLGKHPYYHLGLYYIQEPSAMIPAELLAPEPGDKVADLCAAPGGKTTQIASQLKGSGFILSNDFNPKRTKALAKNIKMMGIQNILVTHTSPTFLARYYENYFDKVLVDAPCSGEGMFGRDKNAIKNWSTDYVFECQTLQRNILEDAIKMLKPGGILVYSTCTFSPEEDEINIQFLMDNYGLELVCEHKLSEMTSSILKGCVRAWPHKLSGHGHFAAKLKKPLADITSQKTLSPPKAIKPFDAKEISGFTQAFHRFSFENLYEYNQEIYNIDDISSIKVDSKIEYVGVKVGSFIKQKFIPSQELAMCISPTDYKYCYPLSSTQVECSKYLKGETLFSDLPNGWVLICIDGFPAGWAKSINGMLKNYYDANWRML